MIRFAKHIFLLVFLQIRKILSDRFRYAFTRFTRKYFPAADAFLTRVSLRAKSVPDTKGIRGVSWNYFRYFIEFVELLRWYKADPVRPSIFRATIPTVMKFIAIVCQTSAFAIMAGYLTLSTNEWMFQWRDYTFDLTPTPFTIICFTATIFSLYALFAALNFIAGMMMLNVGIHYQRNLTTRLVTHYHTLLTDQHKRQYISRTDMMTILNTEARYLARALMMCYNMLFQAGLVLIGATMLIILDRRMIFLAIAFIAVSLLVQVSVIGKTLRDTRHMISLDGKNKAALSKALQKLTSEPSSLNLESHSVEKLVDVQDIRNYDMSYYDRLRIGLFATLTPQIVFAVFLTGIVIFAVLMVDNGGMSAALAVQYVFSLRFFVAGVTGLLIAFVSIISYKPYFENYLEAIEFTASKYTKSSIGNHTSKGLSVPSFKYGDVLFILANQSEATWLDAKEIIFHLKDYLPEELSLRDISLVNVELISPQKNWRTIFGVDTYESLVKKLNSISTKSTQNLILAVISNLEKCQKSGTDFDALWGQLDVTDVTQISMVAAALTDSKIVIMPERGYRVFAEREREQALNDWFKNKLILVVSPAVPQIILEPAPRAYLWIDHTGVKSEVFVEDFKAVENSFKVEFYNTTLGGKTKAALEEIF